MQDKQLIEAAKVVLFRCNNARSEAERAVNDILTERKNEIVVLDDPAYVLVDGGEGWVETPIRAVRMNDDGVILLSETSTMSSAADNAVWEEDDDYVNVNWPSVLEALIRALEKDEPKTKTYPYSVYLTVRVDYESDRELDDDDVQDFVANLDYGFISRTENVRVTDTEICCIND